MKLSILLTILFHKTDLEVIQKTSVTETYKPNVFKLLAKHGKRHIAIILKCNLSKWNVTV